MGTEEPHEPTERNNGIRGSVEPPKPGTRVPPASPFLVAPRLPHMVGEASGVGSSCSPQIYCVLKAGSAGTQAQEHRNCHREQKFEGLGQRGNVL